MCEKHTVSHQWDLDEETLTHQIHIQTSHHDSAKKENISFADYNIIEKYVSVCVCVCGCLPEGWD